MVTTALSARLSRLGLRQAGLARVLGVPATTVNRWAVGVHPMPAPAERFVTLLEACPQAAEVAREWARREPNQPMHVSGKEVME
jgi:DNA-binding transcriptional regulator YdaS (Cro superfamily)